jgi:hypothetical protein
MNGKQENTYSLRSDTAFDDFACFGIVAHPACYVEGCGGLLEYGVGVVAVWRWGGGGVEGLAGVGLGHDGWLWTGWAGRGLRVVVSTVEQIPEG